LSPGFLNTVGQNNSVFDFDAQYSPHGAEPNSHDVSPDSAWAEGDLVECNAGSRGSLGLGFPSLPKRTTYLSLQEQTKFSGEGMRDHRAFIPAWRIDISVLE
jgi:hypothetical protein